jgi:hypothetical protein
MLRIYMISLALVSVLVMSAVAAGSASASHLWLLNSKLIATPVTLHSHGTLELEDSKATGGAIRIKCTRFDTGTVGPHALDLISKETAEKLGTNDKIPCTFVKQGACKATPAPTILALHLPWHTELYLIGGEERDMVESDGAGEPGWYITCTNVLGGITEDECRTTLGSTALTNVVGGVLATFDVNMHFPTCSIGGENAGRLEGDALLLSPSAGEKLTFD